MPSCTKGKEHRKTECGARPEVSCGVWGLRPVDLCGEENCPVSESVALEADGVMRSLPGVSQYLPGLLGSLRWWGVCWEQWQLAWAWAAALNPHLPVEVSIFPQQMQRMNCNSLCLGGEESGALRPGEENTQLMRWEIGDGEEERGGMAGRCRSRNGRLLLVPERT